MTTVRILLTFVLVAGLSACQSDAPRNPMEAEQSFGRSIPVIDAVPVPAVVAELDRYRGRTVTVDGRIRRVDEGRCSVQLETDTSLVFQVEAPVESSGVCTWSVPSDLRGILLARGRLTTAGDTVRLTAPGVQVTPLQVGDPAP